MTSLIKTQYPTNRDFFGGLFSPQLTKLFFEDLNQTFEKAYNVKSIYPYDLIFYKNKDEIVEKCKLNFALSGFSKEDISVKVVDGELKIEVITSEENETNNVTEYVHHGIAHRNMKVSFKIGSLVDKKNITMKYENGLLMIDIPFKEKETYEIEFK